MATKRVSPTPAKKTVRRKATASPPVKDSGTIAARELNHTVHANPVNTNPVGASSIDPAIRRQLVAAEAYFRAEKRGFAAGHELDDWVAAERMVDLRFERMQVA